MNRREQNRRIVTDFYTKAFIEQRYEEAAREYLHPQYVQHNPFVPDGAEDGCGRTCSIRRIAA